MDTGNASRRSKLLAAAIVLFVAALGAALGLGLVHPLPWPGLDDLPARIIGYGFGALGVGLVAWGTVTLRRAHTDLLPHRGADKLVTDGPFRIWRNPLYMGETLMLLGLAQATGNVWMAIAAPLFALGVLLLLGIVKKNGILQIDYMNHLRNEGFPLRKAIMEANRVRLRPILMTTLAIIAGLIPTAVGMGVGASQRSAIAVTIIGGQSLCLVLTLLVVPVGYSLIEDARAWLTRGKHAPVTSPAHGD